MRKQMQENQLIQLSQSPWASPIVLGKRRDGTLQFCVDYRCLTVRDAYPLPRVKDSSAALGRAQYFSTLDTGRCRFEWKIRKGRPSSVGLYEFLQMPFRVNNAPATFQQLMELCLGDLKQEWLLIYLDDIIMFSSTFQEHLQKAEQVLRRLEELGGKAEAPQVICSERVQRTLATGCPERVCRH